MRLAEIARLLHVSRPDTRSGAQKLARCFSIEDVAQRARRRLPEGAWAYLETGGEGEYTLRRNRTAFDDFELVPVQPREVSDIDLSTTVLGQKIPLPFALAPVGAPRMFHHEGELAVARAAQTYGIPYGISTLATTSAEDVAAVTRSPLWFQAYLWGDRREAKEAISRARDAGFRALLISIDTNYRSKREREKRAGLELPTPNLRFRTLVDGACHPSWSWHFLTSDVISFPNIGPPDHRSRDKLPEMFDGSVGWRDLDWIRQIWDGPVLVKGVIRPEEAARAVEEGLAGVVVSNHGGRQLDHVPATIDVLADIVDAAGGRLDVLVDSGFRRGSDLVIALALGAKAVLLGRAHLYGLAAAGEAGVRHCLDIMIEELRMTMALCGVQSIAEIDRSLVRHRPSRQPDAPLEARPAPWSDHAGG